MVFNNFRRNNQGFTLIEQLVVVLILGIMASIAAPNYIKWLNNKRVDDVLVQLEGALKEAQSEAIKKSKPCDVTVGTTITATVSGTTEGCLATGPRDLSKLGVRILGNNDSGIAIAVSNGNTVQFSHLGTTVTDNIFVVYRGDTTAKMRCLSISTGIGIMRTGIYTGSNPPGAITESSCVTTSS